MLMLSKEALEYGDILQIDVNDVYKHLTHKTLSGFLWSKKFCPNALKWMTIIHYIGIF